VFNILAPDILLPSTSNIWADEYPFSVKVQKKISELDLMNITRDHYENTEFDTSRGLAGGPFGDPNRFDVAATSDMTNQKAHSGSFPRTISMFRTSYSFVGKPRASVPNVLSLIYFTQYNPDISTFTPIYVHSEKIATPYMKGSMHSYNTASAWWNACVIGNYISRFYNYAIQPVREVQTRLETDFYLKTSLIETMVIELLNEKKSADNPEDIDNKITKLLTDFTIESGNTVNEEYKTLFPLLLAKYRDGYEIDVDKVSVGITPKFYPKWWLNEVGYFDELAHKDWAGNLIKPLTQII
jgi:dipeptidase